MSRNLRQLGAIASLLPMFACGGGGDTPEPITGGGTAAFRATVDGVPWTMNSAASLALADAEGTFTIVGANAALPLRSISLRISGIDATGTSPLGVTMVRGGVLGITETSDERVWVSPLTGAAGSVTITSLTPTRIAGTFSGPVVADTSATTPTNRTVTAGSFDVPITGPATRVVPPNFGGSVTGTIEGIAFTPSELFATKQVPGVSTDSSITLITGNQARLVSFIILDFKGVGTYAIGQTTGNSALLATQTGPAGTWGTLGTTTTGSIVITSSTASRIKGTITVTMPPASGAARNPAPVALTFDAGIL